VGIIRSAVIGCGRYLPEKILTNDELATMVDTSNEWIVQRTGISARHIASDDETTSDLGTKAAKAALENAGVDASSIDLIILATSTPDYTFPASSVQVQHNLVAQRLMCKPFVQVSCSPCRPQTLISARVKRSGFW